MFFLHDLIDLYVEVSLSSQLELGAWSLKVYRCVNFGKPRQDTLERVNFPNGKPTWHNSPGWLINQSRHSQSILSTWTWTETLLASCRLHYLTPAPRPQTSLKQLKDLWSVLSPTRADSASIPTCWAFPSTGRTRQGPAEIAKLVVISKVEQLNL